MPIRVAIVGPGRVGQALGRRLVESGVELLGFVGRRPESTRAALEFCGAGAAMSLADLRAAAVVMLAVGDAEIPAVVDAAVAARSPRRCSLWLHCSGLYGLEVLAPLAALGARLGGLHPVTPFPDAASGHAALPGRPAVLLAQTSARHLVETLAERVGLRPIWSGPGDRRLYHAACALAANGLTVLQDLAEGVLDAYGGLSAADAGYLVHELMSSALRACRERGAAGALSGPAVRGDEAALAAHLESLRSAAPGALPAYRALLSHAVEVAHRRGDLDADRLQQLLALLTAGESP